MILDSGICSVFRRQNIALSGEMPRPGFQLIGQSWFGELNFETSPNRPTEGRQELRTDARVRILQNREIKQNDVVVLRELPEFEQRGEDDAVFRITRAWHGTDESGTTPVSDLSLEVIRP